MNLKITSSIKRIKQYVTLTASAYQPLLCKHVVLATMQYKEEVKKILKYFGEFLIKYIRKQTTKLTRNLILQVGVQICHPVILLA